MIRLAISCSTENCFLAEPWFRLSASPVCVCACSFPGRGRGGDARHLLPLLVVALALWLWETLSGTGALGSVGSALINVKHGKFAHQKLSKLRGEV